MPLDVPSYDNLSAMYGNNPFSARQAQEGLDLRSQFAQSLMQQQQTENDQTSALNPLKLAEQRTLNGMREAQLTQQQTRNTSDALDLKGKQATHDAEIEAALSGYKGKIGADELARITRSGEMYNQAGGLLKTMPPAAAHAVAKQLLGDNYHPEWANLPPVELVKTISNAGQYMTTASGKYQAMMDKQDSVNAAKLAAEQEKTERAKALATYKSRLSSTVAKVAKADKVTRENVLGSLAQAMVTEQDPDKHAALTAEYNRLAAQLQAEKVQQRAAGAIGKVDPASLGMESVPMPAPPQLAPKPGTPAPAPAKKPEHSLADVQKQYPGVPADKLKQAYKKKFGVDLQ